MSVANCPFQHVWFLLKYNQKNLGFCGQSGSGIEALFALSSSLNDHFYKNPDEALQSVDR